MGWGAAAYFGRTPLDSGVATLVGSAIGAGLTVVGSVWVARYQTNAEQRAFNRLAGDAIGAIRDEAHCLILLTEMKGFETKSLEAAKLKGQVGILKEALGLYERTVMGSKFAEYDFQLWNSRLEKQIADNVLVLEKELRWLSGTLSDKVMQNARGALSYSASLIVEACDGALNELGDDRPLPTEADLTKRIAVFQPDED